MWPIFLGRTSTKWEDVITPKMYNDELQKLELCITQLEEGTLSYSMYDAKG
jgi:hypothetical protein